LLWELFFRSCCFSLLCYLDSSLEPPRNQQNALLGRCRKGYRSALRRLQPDRILYLAISEDIYQEFFLNAFIQEVIADYQVQLLIVSALRQEVTLWKE
jgi:XisH protein